MGFASIGFATLTAANVTHRFCGNLRCPAHMAQVEDTRELLYGFIRAVCNAKAHEEVPTTMLEEVESGGQVAMVRPQRIPRELRCTNRGLWASWALFERQYY